MKNVLLTCLLLVCSIISASSQSVGSFDELITMNGEGRIVSCFVPANYDSTKPMAVLIALHGLGDNAQNYRSALVQSLNWPSLFPNTMIICPDGGNDRNKDFYTPDGDETIIDSCIKLAESRYEIDASQIILQGFSLGGRSALKYGLDRPGTFKGLLLSTPAMQGIADVLNDSLGSLQFAYENASQVPIFITVGEADATYASTVQMMTRKLKGNGGRVEYIVVPGMGHTIPGSIVNSKALPFFEQTEFTETDVDLFEIQMPEYVCGDTIPVLVSLQTRSVVTSLTLELIAGEDTTRAMLQVELNPYGMLMTDIGLPVTSPGVKQVNVRVVDVNGVIMQETGVTHMQTASVVVAPETGATKLEETFDSDTSSWVRRETGNLFTWYRDTDVKRSGTASIAAFNTILLFYTAGLTERISSQYFDVSRLEAKQMTFDYAFNYHKFTTQYFTSETIFTDTLDIRISTDCGETFTSLFRKSGADLATTEQPIIDPVQIQSCFFIPKDNEWKHVTIDLSAYASAANAIIAFDYISGMGGSINIDNINIGSNVSSVDADNTPSTCGLYPNPSDGRFQIEVPVTGIGVLKIYDQLGAIVYTGSHTFNSGMPTTINAQDLSVGTYAVDIESRGSHYHSRLVIQR